MPRRKPTDAELAILRVLWARGPSTVREVAAVLGRDGAYTTILKLLQIMTDKGLVVRDESQRAHLVSDLLDRAFGGSASKLVLHALEARKATPEELAEIRRLLDQRRGGT